MECRNKMVDFWPFLYCLSASGSYGPPEGCVCIQARVAGCRFFFFRSQNSKRVITQLIWIFREVVVLLNNLEVAKGRIKCGHILRLYDQLRNRVLCSFLSFKQFIYLYSNNTTGYRTIITSFSSKSTDKARSSLYVELMLHDNYCIP